MLSPLFDMLPPGQLEQVLAALRPIGTTVLQFTARPEGLARDGWLWIGKKTQQRAATLDGILPLPRDELALSDRAYPGGASAPGTKEG